MGFRTFLGPLLLGTQKWGSGRNTGAVLCAQTFTSSDLTGSAVGNIDAQIMTLPRGARIYDIIVDQIVAATAGTTTVSVGTSAGGAELMAGVVTTAGGRFRGTATAATQAAWNITAATDIPIYVRLAVGVATLTAGQFEVHVIYQVREVDGTTYPTAG